MIVHGQEIQPRDVEKATFHWDAGRFAALCNDFVWAETARQTGSIPLMTGRIYVADNGEDAEWIGTPKRGARKAGVYLRPGTNVFQYKKRSVADTDRSTIVRSLRSDLRGAIADVEERTGKTVASYIFFTNVDLTITQQESLARALRHGRQDTNVVIMGAAQIAAALNALPYLRSAYFVTEGFRTWEAAWQAHAALIASGADVDLLGREVELAPLAGCLSDSGVRAAILTGPPSIGKTRLALEVTRDRPFNFVEVLGRHATLVSDLYSLYGETDETIVLVDDPDPDVAKRLVKEVLAQPRLKLLLTVPTSDAAAVPNFGFDARVHRLDLNPLSDEAAQELVQSVDQKIDYGIVTWIVQMAGGVPGILMVAARVGPELRELSGDFNENVASALEAKARDRLTEQQFESLQLLSCLSFIGIEGDPQAEIRTVCKLFGGNLRSVLNSIGPLCSTGFLRHNGSYAEVSPPLLANRLAENLLRNYPDASDALFRQLNPAGLRRFLRRAVQLRGAAIEAFWASLVKPPGPFGSLSELVSNASLFHNCAVSLPARFATDVANALAEAGLEARKEISGDARRHLVWGLQDMLLRSDTSEAALKGLGELAEAENENYGNNATGVFGAAFQPLHSQIPLVLMRRLNVVRSFMDRSGRESRLLVGLEACEAALRRSFVTTLMRSSGSQPSGLRPTMTYGEIWQYQRDVLDLIKNAAVDEREGVRRRAKDLLPTAAENLVSQGTTDRAVEVLEEVLDQVLEGDFEFDVSDVALCLWRGEKNLQKIAEVQSDLTPYLDRVAQARRRLDEGPFSVRLRKLVGGWTFVDEEVNDARSLSERRSARIDDLAREACAHPSPLDDGSIEWMVAGRAQRAIEFWTDLGMHDVSRTWTARLEELAVDDRAASVFQSYLDGWRKQDPTGALNWFRSLTESEQISPLAILLGTLVADTADDSAERIRGLLASEAVEARVVAGVIQAGGWMAQVGTDGLVGVLRGIAGPSFERAGLIPQTIAFRFGVQRRMEPSLAEFLWRCLEVRPSLPDSNAEYYCDELAARLAKVDPERGFALLEQLAGAPYRSQVWDPLGLGRHHDFWDTLCIIDRARALLVALAAAKRDSALLGGQLLSEVIDTNADRAVLLEFSDYGQEEASIVADTLSRQPAGYWQLAFSLVERYPNSQRVLRGLYWGLTRRGDVIVGPMSLHLENCRAEAKRALAEDSPPPLARSWLENEIQTLGREIETERQREANERVNW